MGKNSTAVGADVEAFDWVGLRADDAYGARFGRVEAVYASLDDEPVWMLVRRGRFGDERALVPVPGAARAGDGVCVPYELKDVLSAPRPPADPAELTRDAEIALTLHYGVAERLPALRGMRPGAVTARIARVVHAQPAGVRA